MVSIHDKSIDKRTPKLSIVTVTYNAEKQLQKTIDSIIGQTWTNYEYLIKDGGSSDRTKEIAESYSERFERKGICFRFIENKDTGIYDAMNGAVGYCLGEWISFMNAGDTFVNYSVLNDLFRTKFEKEAVCIYGNTVNEKYGNKYVKKGMKIEKIYYRVPFIHQAVIMKREILSKYRFNTDYKLAADYDLYCRLYDDGLAFQYVDLNIAVFNLYGVSQTSHDLADIETNSIQLNHGYLGKAKIQRFIFNDIVIRLKRNDHLYRLFTYVLSALRFKDKRQI